MTYANFVLFLDKLFGIARRYWALLGDFEFAGITLNVWLLSFLGLSFVFLAFKATIGSPAGSLTDTASRINSASDGGSDSKKS